MTAELKKIRAAIQQIEASELAEEAKRVTLNWWREKEKLAAVDNRIAFGLDGDRFRVDSVLFKPSKGLEYLGRILHSRRTLELAELKSYSTEPDVDGITSKSDYYFTKRVLKSISLSLANPDPSLTIEDLECLQSEQKRYQRAIDQVKYAMHKYKAGDTEAERTRKSVGNAVNRAIDVIADHPDTAHIGEDLKQNIVGGSSFYYSGKYLFKKV